MHRRKGVDPAILISALAAIGVMCGALLDEDSLGNTLLGRGWDLDWPYGYYVFLRVVVCLASVVVAVKGHEWQHAPTDRATGARQ